MSSTSKVGIVIGTKMMKTIKVRVESIKIHPLVLKPVRYHKNFMAHDENETCVLGDFVRIDACKKVSKMKNFTLGEIVRPAQVVHNGMTGKVAHSQGDFRKEDPAHYNLDLYKK